MIGTIFVSAIIIVIVGLIIYKQIKNKKEGKAACSCGGCSGCSMQEFCHKDNK